MEQKQKMAEEVKEAQAIGKTNVCTDIHSISLEEAKKGDREAIKKALGGVFRWETKRQTPLENVFGGTKLFNAVYEIVVKSAKKEETFIVLGGEKVKITYKTLAIDFFNLFNATRKASATQALYTIDANKKRIYLHDNAIRVMA